MLGAPRSGKERTGGKAAHLPYPPGWYDGRSHLPAFLLPMGE